MSGEGMVIHVITSWHIGEFPDAICSMHTGEIIPIAESHFTKIGRFCVSWPAEVRKVTREPATHTKQGQHKGEISSVSYIIE